MKWYVYIAQAESGEYYTGISANPQKRLVRHNKGNGARFALQYGLLGLVYVSPPYSSRAEARKREIQVKDWSQIKKRKLIQGELK